MDVEAYPFLSSVSFLAMLPKSELEQIASHLTLLTCAEGTVLATQGKTRLSGLYILKQGVLEAFFEEKGKKVLSLTLLPGDIYGGISILMNAGISIRTVRAKAAAILYLLPADRFSRACAANKAFNDQFVDAFAKRMADEAYAGRVTENQAFQFLSGTAPFSFLPEDAIEEAAVQLSMLYCPRDSLMLYQGISKVEHLYIIHKGAAEIFYEEAGRKTMSALLSEGDIYGGISLLMNAGTSVRTLRTVEDSYFFTLPASVFLDLCQKYDVLTEFFTDTFGKRMLDRTYASIVARSLHPGEDGAQLFDQPVARFIAKNPVACEDGTTIQQAAAQMSRHRCSSILVRKPTGQFVGLITDHDLRNKVIAKGLDIGRPVADILSSPLRTVSAQALVFEALMTMTQANIKHLAVTDPNGQVIGMITNRDLINAQNRSPLFLVREIMSARHPDDILDQSAQLARLIQDLMHSGAKAKNITRMITTISDAIVHRIVDFVFQEMGPAPARFAFMVLGSEGRREQTLKTDQDNAIVFEDISGERELERARAYFKAFGERMCGLLDRAGYAYCDGGVMAQNPRWCQPVGVWKNYFKTWIHAADPKDLLEASIFFDFRCGFGDLHLIGELRQYLFDALTGWAGFFRHLTENALYFKPPLGFFRNLVVASKGEHRNLLDLKAAMMPIVDIARIYALKHRVEATNTMERLGRLHQIGVFPDETFNELDLAYGFLMQMRFSRQVTAILASKSPPDNHINPKQLSPVERTMLKEIFKRIEKYQLQLSFDFTGAP
jgi:CBS domain-containing protein